MVFEFIILRLILVNQTSFLLIALYHNLHMTLKFSIKYLMCYSDFNSTIKFISEYINFKILKNFSRIQIFHNLLLLLFFFFCLFSVVLEFWQLKFIMKKMYCTISIRACAI